MSYYFFKNHDMERVMEGVPPGVDTFADSGAYSAYLTGESLDVKQYATWGLKWRKQFRMFANLDVKGSWQEGLTHQRYLESIGITPIPVFHAGEPWELLDQYIEEYPYIALGGVAGIFLKTTGPVMMGWFAECFKRAQGKSVYHGFGIAHPELMISFPWYSIDTSSWAGARYGLVNLFDDRTGKFVRIQTGNYRSAIKHAHLFLLHRLDWESFANREKFSSFDVQVSSIRAYMMMQDYYQKKWGEVTMPASRSAHPLYQAEPGIKVYLAFVNRVCIDMAMKAVVP